MPYSNWDDESFEEMLAERYACEQEAFEQFCYEQDIDPTTEEAAAAWREVIEKEQREAYTERQIDEFQWRQQDEQEYLDSMEEWA